MKRGYWIAKMIVIGTAAVTLFTYFTMLLWNWLVPVIFNGPVINFWQMLGLFILSKILFSGFGPRRHYAGNGPWKRHWRGKWNTMSDDEKLRFKEKMKEKWCGHMKPTEPNQGTTIV